MNIWASPYQLESVKDDLPDQKGVLLRIQFPTGRTGYADFMPWPQLGEETLSQQLEHLSRLELTPRLEQSLFFASWDSERSNKKISLAKLPKHHWLATNLDDAEKLVRAGHKLIKIKAGPQNLPELSDFIESNPTCRFRIDFNNSLDEMIFYNWLCGLESREMIDFIEDPYPYDPILWKEVMDEFSISLALDGWLGNFPEDLKGVSHLILKPVLIPADRVLNRLASKNFRFVVTHCLDHPLGQIQAKAFAALALEEGFALESSGLGQVSLYQPTLFDKQMAEIEKQGVGAHWGYQEILETLDWKLIFEEKH